MKKNLKYILDYIMCIIVVFLSGSAYIAANEDNSLFRILSVVLIILCIVRSPIKAKITKSIVYISLGVLVLMLINFCTNEDTIKGLALRVLWIVCFFNMISKTDFNRERFFEILYNVVILISFVSLIAFLVLNVISYKGDYTYLANGRDLYFYKIHYGFYFAAETYLREVFGFVFYRMQSFFWEPGVYAIYLVLSIYHYVFNNKDNKLHLFLLMTCLLLTMSTTGICIGVVLFFIWYVKKTNVNRHSKLLLSFIASIFACTLALFVFYQKKVESGTSGSYYLRMLDLIKGLELFVERPLFGFGYKSDIYNLKLLTDRGNSNGIINLLCDMGVMGLFMVFSPFLINVIKTIKNNRNRFDKFLFFGIFVLTNMSEPLIYSPLMIFIIALEYKEWFSNNRTCTLYVRKV